MVALVAAVAASAGDLGLLWVSLAEDGRLGIAHPPHGTLAAGHHLGVIGIPFYALGYRHLAGGIGTAHPRAARAVWLLGIVGSVLGAVVHGMTGVLIATQRSRGATAPAEVFTVAAGLVLPIAGAVAVAMLAGSIVFAVSVFGGRTHFPRWMALCNPLAATIALALATAPFPRVAAFVAPAAPNLAHVIVFGAALLARNPPG